MLFCFCFSVPVLFASSDGLYLRMVDNQARIKFDFGKHPFTIITYHSSIHIFFLWKLPRQNNTDVTPFCKQYVKVGYWSLRGAFPVVEGVSTVLVERE